MERKHTSDAQEIHHEHDDIALAPSEACD